MAARLLPRGHEAREFLRFYAARFDTVELNTTGYRLPAEEQFRRWAETVPDGFRFAPKLALTRLDRLTVSLERLAALGDRLGPVRVVIESPRDDGLLAFVAGSVDPAVELAFDFRHESWRGRRRARDRERPRRASRSATSACASRRTPTTTSPRSRRSLTGPAYVYFRHEDEPTAPAYAARLAELIAARPA